jgi:hypothetical protein
LEVYRPGPFEAKIDVYYDDKDLQKAVLKVYGVAKDQ